METSVIYGEREDKITNAQKSNSLSSLYCITLGEDILKLSPIITLLEF